MSTQSEQALFLRQLDLPILQFEHRTTRGVIEAIPSDAPDYRPDPKAKSAMEIAWHIVASEHRFLRGVAAGAFDFTPIHRPDAVRNSTEIGAWFGESFEKSVEEISKLTGEQLAKAVDFRGMFSLPAANFLAFALRHTIHHRGQLSTYLRPMGGKVPAIYGESYDSAEAKKAAGAQK